MSNEQPQRETRRMWRWDDRNDVPAYFEGYPEREGPAWEKYGKGRTGWSRASDGCFMGWEGEVILPSIEALLAAEIEAAERHVEIHREDLREAEERLTRLQLLQGVIESGGTVGPQEEIE